jgi:hypothetical protein
MANHFRVIYDDKPISWYIARGEHRTDALKRTLDRIPEELNEGESLLRYTSESGTATLEDGESWWFKFLIQVPD